MKKLILAFSSLAILAGCAAGIDESNPVEKQANLNKICIDERKTGLNYTSREIVEFVDASLKKKGISSMTYKENKEQCQYLLQYRFRGKKELIMRGSMTVTKLGTEKSKDKLGYVTYKYRGDEREIAKQVGLKGQIDKMVTELFKNY